MKFAYAGPGAPKDIPADVAGAELQRLYERDGGIRPSAVVEESRPDTAPLHTAFEWDDETAAEQYRLEQARQLVRAVVLMPEPEQGEVLPSIRAFVSLHDPVSDRPQSRVYKPLMVVLQNPDESAELKSRALRDLLAFRQRYMALLEVDRAVAKQFESLEAALAG